MITIRERGSVDTSVSGCLAAGAIALFCSSLSSHRKPELRIAAIISVTGAASALGAPERNAIELFDKKWSSRSDLPFRIKVVSYDDGSDPTKAVSLTRKAVEEDRAHVVVCCTTTPGSLAIIDTVNAAKVTMISMASSAAIVEPASARAHARGDAGLRRPGSGRDQGTEAGRLRCSAAGCNGIRG